MADKSYSSIVKVANGLPESLPPVQVIDEVKPAAKPEPVQKSEPEQKSKVICQGNPENNNICNNVECHASGAPHSNPYLPPLCKFGVGCGYGPRCTYSHALSKWLQAQAKRSCKYGVKCRMWACWFGHPDCRATKCEQGADCKNEDPTHRSDFLHPVQLKAEEPLCRLDDQPGGCKIFECQYRHVKSKPRCTEDCTILTKEHRQEFVHCLPECKYGDYCYNADCWKFNKHPSSWPGACKQGNHCTNERCKYVHGHDEELLDPTREVVVPGTCSECGSLIKLVTGRAVPKYCPARRAGKRQS